ncbi:MAG: mannose-6-phosphate isomerase [Alicyclobacillus sp. RIFOXYA1_FULL_53_8]|nr:MAG: mannose-6-phosphate isomerase [Alicyclobacillus sp. RIFOXYA1_FULL_53_8]
MYPVKFAPIPMERIWGGQKLKAQFDEHGGSPIGEYWVLSGHPNGASVVTNGEFAGKTLVELTTEFPSEYLGESPQPRFPLLIKFLEANQDLSVQIHPDDAYAQLHEGDFGKTEAWYVLDCRSDGRVNFGHRFSNREQYLQAVQGRKVQSYLEYQDIQKGDVVFVPARTLHALLADTVVIEVQQTSDITYRVYDWDRVDESGRRRDLHVDKAADVLHYGDPAAGGIRREFAVLRNTQGVRHESLATCPYFALERVRVEQSTVSMSTGHPGNPDIWIVADGEGELRYGSNQSLALRAGDAVLVPASVRNYALTSDRSLTALRAFY